MPPELVQRDDTGRVRRDPQNSHWKPLIGPTQDQNAAPG